MNALFAAGIDADLIRLLVIFLIFAVPAIGKMLANMQAAKANRPPETPKPPLANAAEEIDEFLRRAKQASEPQAGSADVSPATTNSGETPSLRRRSSSTGSHAKSSAQAQPVQAEVVGSKPVGGQVTDHVTKYLDAEEFSRRSAQLGEEVVKADQQIDQHLHQVFDHNLSELAAAPGETAIAPEAAEPSELSAAAATEEPAPFVVDLVSMVANPESMGQAIVLSEIFRRPDERW